MWKDEPTAGGASIDEEQSVMVPMLDHPGGMFEVYGLGRWNQAMASKLELHPADTPMV
jgi:hypothetical protein